MPLFSKRASPAQAQVDAVNKAISKRPSFGDPAAPVSGTDVALNTERNAAATAAQAEIGNARKLEVYGASDANPDATPKPESPISGALKFLNAPVAAGSAVLGHVIGKDTVPGGLYANVKARVAAGGEYTDTLRAAGLPQWASLPLGLALDFGLDFGAGWLSSGSEALIPRLGLGALKAGPEGVAVAARSYLSSRKSGLMNAFSKDYRAYVSAPDAMSASYPKWFRGIAEGATKNTKLWDDIAHGGSDAVQRISDAQPGLIDKAGKAIGEALDKFRPGLAEDTRDFWTSNHPKFARETALKDAILRGDSSVSNYEEASSKLGMSQAKVDAARAHAAKGEAMGEEVARRGFATLSSDDAAAANSASRTGSDDVTSAMNMQAGEDALSKARLQQRVVELGQRYGVDQGKINAVLGEKDAGAGYEAMVKKLAVGHEGYAKAWAKALTSKGLRTALWPYEIYNSIFKRLAVGLSIPSWSHASLGNPALLGLAGVNIANPGLFSSLRTAIKILLNPRSLEDENNAISHIPGMMEHIRINPIDFEQTTGLDPNYVRGKARFLENFQARNDAKITDQSIRDALTILRKTQGDVSHYENMSQEEIHKLVTGLGRTAESDIPVSAMASQRKIAEELTAPFRSDVPDSIMATGLAQEISSNTGDLFARNVKKYANRKLSPDAPLMQKSFQVAAKMFHASITKPITIYGKIDQAWKTATIIHLADNGITLPEINKLQKWFKFAEGEVIKAPRGEIYKLTPAAASRVANEVLLNYQALPGFAKIIKSLPLVGAPFFSFTAAAGQNLLQALAHNPQYYNEVSNIFHAINGSQDPLERKALDSQYSSFLKEPGYLKLPFFPQNKVYLNLAQFFPHYSMSLLGPVQRDYKNEYGSAIAHFIDRSPFMKDPAGEWLLNNVVMPMVFGESLNSFNQQNYPIKSGLATKALIAGADLLNPLVPRTPAAIAGLLPSVLPQKALPYAPNSYGSMEEAKLGNNPQGVPTNENPTQKVVRNLSKELLGIPVQIIDEKNVK